VLSLSALELNELEAFVELMFLAAAADGVVNDAERAAFRGQVLKNTHGQLDAALVDQVLTHLERELHGVDRGKQLASIRDRLRDPRKRRAALVHAARVVLADGVLALDEVEFLHRALSALGEPLSFTEDILRLLHEARESD